MFDDNTLCHANKIKLEPLEIRNVFTLKANSIVIYHLGRRGLKPNTIYRWSDQASIVAQM